MRDNPRKNVLKIIALFTTFSFIYPVLMMGRSFFFSVEESASGYGVILLTVSMGISTAAILCRNSCSILRLLVSYSAVVFPIAFTTAVYSSEGIKRIIFEAFVTTVFYIVGVNVWLYSYDKIFNYQSFITGTFFLFFPLLVVCLNDRYIHLENEILFFACAFILLSLILITQDNIDFIIRKRGVESAEVQKKIRRFNIGIVLVFYAVILLLLNLYKIISFIVDFIQLIFGKIMDFIIYILKLLFREKAGVVYEEGFGFMPFDPQPAWKPIIVLIFYTLIHFVFLLSIYLLLPVVYKGIKSLIALIKSRLFQIINIKPDLDSCNNSECTEIIEFVSINKPETHRQRRNLLLLLDQTYDLSGKIRLMYKILLNLLMENGVIIQKSDTTGEIYEKSTNIKNIDGNFLSMTNIYNEVRYGGISPGEDSFSNIQDKFDRLRNLLNKNNARH